ncbi:MAG: biopolymer transporter ExbD [Verrucomicrobiota bacterium]
MRMPVDGDAPKNPITSMVDIAFLLLIFFLVVMTILTPERDLTMKIPSREGPAPISNRPAIVVVERDGSIYWGEDGGRISVATGSDDLAGLEEMLTITLEAWGEDRPGVMLKVDDEVGQQRFIDVLDVFSSTGIEKVGMLE